MTTLPDVFGMQLMGARWFVVAPSQAAHGTFDRMELSMALLVVDGDLDPLPLRPLRQLESAARGFRMYIASGRAS